MSDQTQGDRSGGVSDGLSVTDTAAKLNLSQMTVYRRCRTRAWPACRSGRKWIVSRAFVDEVVTQLKSGGSFSIEEFAAGWMAQNAQAAAVNTAGAVA